MMQGAVFDLRFEVETNREAGSSGVKIGMEESPDSTGVKRSIHNTRIVQMFF
jgi:hypothetical protein